MKPSAAPEILTYRYLRVAMVALVCGLGASVMVEGWRQNPRCWQTSISAYYYTPAQAMFVGTLIAMGTAMVVIKGSTAIEDTLLNGAGMLAPIVAFVPTPYVAGCNSQTIEEAAKRAGVENNVTALVLLGIIGLAITPVLAHRDSTWRSRQFRWGYPATVAVFIGTALWFWLARDSFIESAHYAAAIPLFGCIVAAAVSNAFGLRAHQTSMGKESASLRNRYSLLAAAMVIAVALMGSYKIAFGWEHGVLFIEATVISLFGVFWVLQTHELWSSTVRGVTTSRG